MNRWSPASSKPNTIEKLLKTGYSTLKSVAVTPVREIAERAGMGDGHRV